MLTISGIARRYKITNLQVQDLIKHGYLPVTRIDRSNKGIIYLFAEEDVDSIDIYSLLADIRQRKHYKTRLAAIEHTTDYKKAKRLMGFFDRFLDNIADLPEREALLACWYLFHLNHYAKKYHKMSNDLYNLKSRVLQKLYQENRSIMEATYLIGPDRLNIWLCEDCKETAHAAGLSYADYIREGQYCPKCEIRSIIKEYYSLIEFTIKSFDYRFVFHLPYLRAVQWLQGIDKLPEGIRKQNPYNDKMYLYGRSVTRIEEQLFPVQSVINHLRGFLNDDYNMRIVYNR